MAKVRQYRGRWVADFRDQHKRRRIEVPEGHFETKAQEKRAAQELLTRRLSEVNSSTFTPDRQRMTVADLSAMWLASKVKIGDTTRDDYLITLRCYLLPYFGSRRAETMTRLDIEAFRAELAAGIPDVIRIAREKALEELRAENPKARMPRLDPGPRTINKCLVVLGAVFGYGAEHNIVVKNIAKGVERLPASKGEDRLIEQNVLTPAEIAATIANATDPWRIPIMIAAHTGMRQGEVLGLQWGDIDWNKNSVEVRRNLTRRRKMGSPKTATSRRTVELPAIVISELKRWRLACPKDVENPGALDLICPSTKGKMMQPSALLMAGLYPALRRAGIRQVRFHDLRHSWASNALANGENIIEVSHNLGHANVHITLVTYAHVIPKQRRGIADRMAARMADAAEQSGNNLETGPVSGSHAGVISAA
jgi:integrase